MLRLLYAVLVSSLEEVFKVATLKDRLGIPESYDSIDIFIYCVQCLVYGIAWGLAYLSVVAGFGVFLYIFVCSPLIWAVGQLLRFLNY